jgi:Eco57I restriction-modification methylase/MmeI, target recognition domain
MSDAAKRFHETWLGMVQPVEGLVVSIPALIEADCFERLPADDHRAFVAMLERDAEGNLRLSDLRAVFTDGLGWSDEHLEDALPEELSLYIPEGPQTLRPTAAFRRPDYEEREVRSDVEPVIQVGADYRLLLWELPLADDGRCLDFDKPEAVTGDWSYPPSKKLERLLRASRVPIGVLASHERIRLLYAPHGEASGHIDFRVADMADVGGRPILEALVMLLSEERLVSVAKDRQLPALLERSRAMQAEVTTALAKQVFFALETMMAGFESADERAAGEWLRPIMELQAETGRDILYEALLSVLLRLVFLLYAEDNALLPTDHPLFARYYSLYALYGRLEDERTRFPDAMDRRYGAWPGLLALFRSLYLGVSHGDPNDGGLRIPARHGHLFDIHRFPFLEGFPQEHAVVPIRDADARAEARVPTVDDETIYQVLKSLIMLKGARLSYRTLYVEQIGSVYEGLMGYRSMRVVSPSARLKPSDSKHTPTWVSVEEITQVATAQREKWLKEHAGLKGKRAKELAKDVAKLCSDESGSALVDAVAARLQQDAVKGRTLAQPGRLVIQPGEERKRTSSHYTPQSLSGPIVARALEPLLACFGELPTSEQILSLKICDPAMGSGAFLVEACRFLSDRLLDAWQREGKTENLFSEEDDLTTYARRQVAERCLYGVDKNPFAVELAKLSLWLITLQREKPFTFLDHSLRCGDSLVGVDLEQITNFHWKVKDRKKRKRKRKAPVQLDLFHRELEISLHEALQARERIAEMSQYDTPEANRDMRIAMEDADDALSRLRLIGDLLIGAFFAESKDKAREKERMRRYDLIQSWLMDANALGPPEELVALAEETRVQLRPFHWAIEFAEVFWGGRVDPLTGEKEEEAAYLDGVVGNPPFLGGKLISKTYGSGMASWLDQLHTSSGNTDLCAHFFRRASRLLGDHGTAGLIATNTISQGDTRDGGLKPLVAEGLTIYDARVSLPWPGDAAVVVTTVHIGKGHPTKHTTTRLDGKPIETLNSRLRPTPERSDPRKLTSNGGLSFQGSNIYGMGFVLDPTEAQELARANPNNREKIFPFVGGREVNSSPDQSYDRYVVNFGRLSLEEAQKWPALLTLVRERVKPGRDRNRSDTGMGAHGKKYWWQHAQRQDPLYDAIRPLPLCLAASRVSKHLLFAFQPTDRVFAESCNIFTFCTHSPFSVLQSRIHEVWVRLLTSTMGTGLRYATSDCFETFPFPKPSPIPEIPTLEAIGERLYTDRAAFMVDTDQGLTKTYNALKDPTVTAKSDHGDRIIHLRQLHLDMDRAVLEAYAEHTADPAWTNIEIPPYTTPQTPAETDLHQRFEDHILDKLFELNETRARG